MSSKRASQSKQRGAKPNAPYPNKPQDGQSASTGGITMKPVWIKYADQYGAIVAGLLFFGLMLALHPFWSVFEYDPDEGNNVIKALMLSRGHALYSEIWSDQPPLFTYMLMWWFKIAGWTIASSRIFVLLFGAAIVFALYDSLRMVSGHLAGLAGALILVCSLDFMALSVSAMLGLPSLAWVTLSIWAMLRWNQTSKTKWLIISGILMGFSLVTKLFAAFVVPVLGIWVLVSAMRGENGWSFKPAKLLPAVIWSAILLGTAGMVLLLTVPMSEMSQLYDAHVTARHSDFFTQPKRIEAYVDNYHDRIADDWQIAVLAGIGLLAALMGRNRSMLIPGAWCIMAYFLVKGHRPIWYHHHILLSIPACMLAGHAVGTVLHGITRNRKSPMALLCGVPLRLAAAGMALYLGVDVVRGEKVFETPKSMVAWADRDRFASEVMRSYADIAKTVLVDRQMYAFYAGLDIPPNFSVTSQKRLNTGNLTDEDIMKFLTDEHPELVLISWRFAGSRRQLYNRIAGHVQDDYQLIYRDKGINLLLYARKDIDRDPAEMIANAVQRQPDYSIGYVAEGLMLNKQNKTEEALKCFRSAIDRDSRCEQAHMELADTLMANGDMEAGFGALQSGMTASTDPTHSVARHYAWRRATCRDSQFRDGEQAEQVIRSVMKGLGRQTVDDLITLAAAFAAQGKFQEAAETATRLEESIRDNRRYARRLRQVEQQIKMYGQGRLILEPVRTPTP